MLLRPYLSFIVSALVIGLFHAGSAASQPFSPSCTAAAPNLEPPIEFEFDSDAMLATWQYEPAFDSGGALLEHGSVVIAPFAEDGTIVENEVFECLDCKPAPTRVTVGGPEFGRANGEVQVYFPSFSEDETTIRMSKLVPGAGGVGDWELQHVPASDGRIMIVPSQDPSLALARIYFRTVTGTFATGFERQDWGWRIDQDPPTDVLFPTPQIRLDNDAGRFFPNAVRIAHKVRLKKSLLDFLFNRSLIQPAVYNLVTQQSTPMLPSLADRTNLALWTWPITHSAPELGGAPVVVGVVKNVQTGVQEIVIWRQQLPAGNWLEWNRIPSLDPAYPCLFHPDTFSVAGKSYVAIQAHAPFFCRIERLPIPSATSVWFASMDPDLPDNEKVQRVVSVETNPNQVSIKTDVEVAVINDSTAKIYYKDFIPPIWDFNPVFTVCESGLSAP